MSNVDDQFVNCLWTQLEELLSFPPEEREQIDIEDVSAWFRNRSSLFQSIEKDSLYSIIRQASLTRSKADQVIVHQGDLGDCFYIILRGTVMVYAKKMPQGGEEVVLSEVQFAKGSKERSRFGQELNTLRAGRCFGELSIVSKNSTRIATVIADEPALLITVSRELYLSLVGEKHAEEIVQRSAFINMHPLFRGWSAAYRNLLTENLQYKKLKFGEQIVEQGAPLDYIYFVIEGQAKVTINPIEHQKSYHQLLNKPPSKLVEVGENAAASGIFNDEDAEDDENTIDPYKSINTMQRRVLKQTEHFYASELRYRELDVCTLGAQGIIGDIEAVLDLPKHISSAFCLQEMSYYQMDRTSFVKFIMKKKPETLEKLRRAVFEKLTYRHSLFDSTIPIYRALMTFFDKPKPKDNRKSIIKIYNARKSHKKPTGINFFEQLTKGKSINAKTRKQSIHPLRRPMHEALQPRDQTTQPATDDQNKTENTNQTKQGRKEKPSKQFTPEEYKELKKKLQVAGKTA